MSQSVVALVAVGLLSLAFRDYVLAVAALLLLAVHLLSTHLAAAGSTLALLRGQSLRIGVFFLMIYFLLPLTNDAFNLRQAGRGLLSALGVLAVLAGVAMSYLGGKGTGVLATQPVVLFGVIIGTLLAVVFLRGIPAGLIIAAGMVAVLGRAVPL